MADTDPAADAGGDNTTRDPNTDRELSRARAEAKTYREDRDRYRKERDGFEAALKQAQEDAKKARDDIDRVQAEARGETDKRTGEVRDSYSKRLIRAKLEVAAIKAGLIDEDDVALIDMGAVKLDADGNPTNVADVLASFKEAKPHKFGDAKKTDQPPASTSSTAKPPPQTGAEPKRASEMTPEELRSFERSLGLRV